MPVIQQVSTEIGVFDQTLRISDSQIRAIDNSVYPRIKIDLEMAHSTRPGTGAINLNISNLTLRLSIIAKGATYPIGELIPAQTFFSLQTGNKVYIYCDLSLDHYGLGQIEKLRESTDLRLRIDGGFLAENQQQPQSKNYVSFSHDLRISKSDWVEDILPRMKYKEVMLVEIPKLIEPQFEGMSVYLIDAWRQYSMGEYDKVLTECRKALEELSKTVKSKGFEKEAGNSQGERKKVPDWEKLLNNSDSGNIIGGIHQKLLGFVAPGAHAGKAINREDADFALMVTHAIVNLVIRKLAPAA